MTRFGARSLVPDRSAASSQDVDGFRARFRGRGSGTGLGEDEGSGVRNTQTQHGAPGGGAVGLRFVAAR